LLTFRDVTFVQRRFLSLEPLLGPLPSLDLTGMDWVIVNGESGPGFRPLELGWVRDIRDRCLRLGVSLFQAMRWIGVGPASGLTVLRTLAVIVIAAVVAAVAWPGIWTSPGPHGSLKQPSKGPFVTLEPGRAVWSGGDDQDLPSCGLVWKNARERRLASNHP
jgi:hypothetical protein